jgi:chitinase
MTFDMHVRTAICIALCALLAGCGYASAGTPAHVLAAYYCGESVHCSPPLPVSAIPADSLTDLIYAFGEPGADNECHRPGHAQANEFAQLRELRRSHPHLRLLLSIGGWGGAPQFSNAALTPRSRRAFAQSCISEYVVRSGFDGIDIDWEFPVHGGIIPSRPQDRTDATALLREIRTQLNALAATTHRQYYLTIAAPAGTWQQGGAYSPADSYDLRAVAGIVDWLNVMTYDMNNIFSPVSAFNAPLRMDPHDPAPAAQRKLDNLTGAVQFYESHGVPASKIVLGMAFYGRGFTDVSATNAGLYSKFKGVFPETPWSTVKTRFLTDPAWQKHWSGTAQAPWIYNTRTHVFFSYDDARSMAIKAGFVRQAHLRGAMFWVLGEDDAQQSLLQALAPIAARDRSSAGESSAASR